MSNKKKMEVLYFVEQYIKRYGYPPTVRDIGKGLGYRSPSTVHGYLRQLKEEHLIESDGSKTENASYQLNSPTKVRQESY